MLMFSLILERKVTTDGLKSYIIEIEFWIWDFQAYIF